MVRVVRDLRLDARMEFLGFRLETVKFAPREMPVNGVTVPALPTNGTGEFTEALAVAPPVTVDTSVNEGGRRYEDRRTSRRKTVARASPVSWSQATARGP